MIDADYFWKRTRNAYDFSVILNTPITFPISWHLAKSDGFSARVNLSDYKGLSAFFAAGHACALFPLGTADSSSTPICRKASFELITTRRSNKRLRSGINFINSQRSSLTSPSVGAMTAVWSRAPCPTLRPR